MDQEIEKTAAAMCETVEVYEAIQPLARVVAEMFVRTHWAHEGVGFKRFQGSRSVLFVVDNSKCNIERSISGYNFAYQVKIVCDVLENAGYFE